MSKWDRQIEINRRWRQRHKAQAADIMRRSHYRRRYSAAIADYDFMFALQDGCCAMCNRPDNYGKRFDIDHDHYSGEARGLLCTACNRLVGRAERMGIQDGKNSLIKIEKYLTGRVEFDILC